MMPGIWEGVRRRKWLILAGELALVIVILLGVRAYQQWGLPVGPAPAMTGWLLDGTPVVPPGVRGGPVLVYFWASWCPVCKFEQSTIDAIARDYPVVTVAMQSGGNGAVQDYLSEHALAFPVINDPHAKTAQRWKVRGVPTLFVLDRDGIIRFTEVGYTTEIGLRTRLWWSLRQG